MVISHTATERYRIGQDVWAGGSGYSKVVLIWLDDKHWWYGLMSDGDYAAYICQDGAALQQRQPAPTRAEAEAAYVRGVAGGEEERE